MSLQNLYTNQTSKKTHTHTFTQTESLQQAYTDTHAHKLAITNSKSYYELYYAYTRIYIISI